TERLNPDVCRLAGMWVDDMCLQAVYEAADDPTICDRLYLEGVRPTCRAYYASLEMAATPPGTPLALTETYTDPVLGLAVDYPAGWQVDAVADAFVHFSAPVPSTSTVGIVRYPQPTDPTLDTVLDEVLQGSEGPRATRTQTLTVGGQPAVQVFFGPHEDWRPDTVVLVADPVGEWWTLDGYGELAVFDQIVSTLRWLPRSLPAPTTTPAGTPVAGGIPFTVCQSSETWTRPSSYAKPCPGAKPPKYLIRDRDSKYGRRFSTIAASSGIKELKTPFQAPKANAHCERFIGSLKRECLDHFLILRRDQLHRLVTQFVDFYNHSRPHQGIRQRIPARFNEDYHPQAGRITSMPVLGGLHHSYARVAYLI
ncbi:MAG: transposase, partial [Chloroflexi bacterium]|nr:transposase [Chloroflexota bacterium]